MWWWRGSGTLWVHYGYTRLIRWFDGLIYSNCSMVWFIRLKQVVWLIRLIRLRILFALLERFKNTVCIACLIQRFTIFCLKHLVVLGFYGFGSSIHLFQTKFWNFKFWFEISKHWTNRNSNAQILFWMFKIYIQMFKTAKHMRKHLNPNPQSFVWIVWTRFWCLEQKFKCLNQFLKSSSIFQLLVQMICEYGTFWTTRWHAWGVL